jgi:hypothetical protein
MIYLFLDEKEMKTNVGKKVGENARYVIVLTFAIGKGDFLLSHLGLLDVLPLPSLPLNAVPPSPPHLFSRNIRARIEM